MACEFVVSFSRADGAAYCDRPAVGFLCTQHDEVNVPSDPEIADPSSLR